MDKRTLERTIDTLSKVITIPPEKQKEMYDKYIEMPEKEVIKDLSKAAYRVVGPDSPYYDYTLTVIRNIQPSVCPPVEKLKQLLEKLFANEIEGNMSLEENHQLINNTLKKYCTLFNQFGIDYYIVGALPCFIKNGIPLFRYHDDIDIMINEEDIPKAQEILENAGYVFYDDRYPSIERYEEMSQNKPPHTVLAQNPNNEFHIGFFCFRREADNSITMREYSHSLENGQVRVDILERKNGIEGTILRYGIDPVNIDGVQFRCEAPESVYHLKSYTKRPKDITDMQKLEPFLNQERLKAIIAHPKENVTIENVTSIEPETLGL